MPQVNTRMNNRRTEGSNISTKSHTKAFNEGIGILTEEIELATQWNRSIILLAIHNSKTGRTDAQQALEKVIIKRGGHVTYINIDSANPDVIRAMSEMPSSKNMVFFVAGLESADEASNGTVHRALNIRRELLVEKKICVVFWLNESEAANLPRLAPDFWSFRHRVVEFAPKHGTKKQSLPVGLFFWEEQIPWMEENNLRDKLKYYEELLMKLSLQEDGEAATRAETILKLVHYSWLLYDIKKFSVYLRDGISHLEKHPIPYYQAWMFNAKGIGLYEEGNKSEASILFMQALNHDPENSLIGMNTSLAAHGLGKNNEAIQLGRRAINKNPGNFHLWRALGYLYLAIGKIEEAITAMAKAQDINPHDLDLHYSLAVCYYKNEQPVECKNELSKAGKYSSPQNVLQQACVSILSGDSNKALTQLKQSLQKGDIRNRHILRDPNLPFLLNPQEFMESY